MNKDVPCPRRHVRVWPTRPRPAEHGRQLRPGTVRLAAVRVAYGPLRAGASGVRHRNAHTDTSPIPTMHVHVPCAGRSAGRCRHPGRPSCPFRTPTPSPYGRPRGAGSQGPMPGGGAALTPATCTTHRNNSPWPIGQAAPAPPAPGPIRRRPGFTGLHTLVQHLAMNMDDLTRIASFAKLYPTLRTDLTAHTHARCMLPAVCTVGCQHPQTPPPLGHSLHMIKRPAMSQLADGKPCHAPYIHLWHVPHILKHTHLSSVYPTPTHPISSLNCNTEHHRHYTNIACLHTLPAHFLMTHHHAMQHPHKYTLHCTPTCTHLPPV